MEPSPPPSSHTAGHLRHKSHSYGPHALQRVAVWKPDSPPPPNKQLPWLVYIHGGAWRDPCITLYDFEPSIGHLSNDQIGGFASVDYRLSPHPDYPQDATSTPEDELRMARHPDHLSDVRSGLRLLMTEYHLGADGYILVGHSAGATLALQHLLLPDDDRDRRSIPPPQAIIAIAGIYDIVGLNDRCQRQYTDFISAAFGPCESDWRAASPITHVSRWPSRAAPTLILAHSPQDELIDADEMRNMAARLADDVCLVPDLVGDHDAPWREGVQIASLVRRVLG
ncbi:hypothetical protein L249_4889 [Ophiocordyceps polyrhachis-furcata BCC 54312]|uniref:Kynurenine formamidase n=1 Tax=Ophiocordyceps polyrhachis-furcata BCC 54312 TaxID=1330021 RepID=A0A367L2V4_9HYPO|nr:hypothetical protein L249_4889 [Ophiocordyceps polyrhachis-furcata BCC 54312]